MKILAIKFYLLTLPILIGSCASEPPPPPLPTTAQDYANSVRMIRDEFKKTTWIQGENMGWGNDKLLLRLFQTDGQEAQYQIYIADHYEDNWRFYDTAYDNTGKKLKVTQLSREVDSCTEKLRACSREEHLIISTNRNYLENIKSTGIKIQISGKGGEEIFILTPEYIEGFLSRTETRSAVSI